LARYLKKIEREREGEGGREGGREGGGGWDQKEKR